MIVGYSKKPSTYWSKIVGLDPSTICRIRPGELWKHVS